MPKDWAFFTPPQVKSGGFERNEFLNFAGDSFGELLEESFAGVDVEVGGVKTRAIVQGNSPSGRALYGSRQVLCRPGILEIGLYVKYHNDIWLIVEPPGYNGVYDSAWILLCNYDLRWQNKNGDVVERKAVFWDVAMHITGESENRNLVVGNMRSRIYLPKDEETVRISRQQRFIVDDFDHAQADDPVVYHASRLNFVEKNKGGGAVLVITLAEDNFNESTDSRERMIADYVEKGA